MPNVQSKKFNLVSDFQAMGDQVEAIARLEKGLAEGLDKQTLLGVTGSGKTFTMANIIANTGRPALVLAPNKTLAGQLCAEFRAFFPNNRVEYFVSYYDYYQPEAYIPSSDTYIEKDSAINEEIDRMRHSCTASLLETRDVIVVASVSCIYGLGDPEDYKKLMVHLRVGDIKKRNEIIEALVSIQYQRNDYDLKRGCFRAKGEVLDIVPASVDSFIIRLIFFDDEIEKIYELNPVTAEVVAARNYVSIYPASHYATDDEKMARARVSIAKELDERLKDLQKAGKVLEAYRLEQRTRYDLEMLAETGFTKGIENYSRHLSGREAGSAPFTLLDFFPQDFIMFIDESHVAVPQIGGMYNGDRARKQALVDYGFRLPSALDNRPLNFSEFEERVGQCIYVSATPGKYEQEHSKLTVEQIIRPTGLLDPLIDIHPVDTQIEDLLDNIRQTIAKGERVLVLTLTKRMSEELSAFLAENKLKVAYIHSDLDNEARLNLLRDLRQGNFDVLVGINLLREGLDLPEVSLIAILDADQQGFLRSRSSLIQIIGRAARNVNGKVIMYADQVTEAMWTAIGETNRRRSIQEDYNKKHNIQPTSIRKEIRAVLSTYEDITLDESLLVAENSDPSYDAELNELELSKKRRAKLKKMSASALAKLIKSLEKDMLKASKALDFEEAAKLRDLMIEAKGIEPNKKN